MLIPTIQEISNHIHRLKKTCDAAKELQIKTLLEGLLWVKSETDANQFCEKLYQAMKGLPETSSLLAICYMMLLRLGTDYPRNNLVDKLPVCPIGLVPIKSEDLFISLDRYHWSVEQLVRHCNTTKSYAHPLTMQTFNSVEILIFNQIATRKGISLSPHRLEARGSSFSIFSYLGMLRAGNRVDLTIRPLDKAYESYPDPFLCSPSFFSGPM